MCEVITMPDGGRAIVCGGHRSRKRCACGRPATLACDWKVPRKRSGTCDAAICDRCTTSPAPEKDLCPAHAKAFEAWLLERDRSRTLFDNFGGSGSRPETTPFPDPVPTPVRAGALTRNPETRPS